jgi:thioesterase CepJ
VPIVDHDGATLAYDVAGDEGGAPVLLVCGCGGPALGWHAGVLPGLVGAGFRVATFDHRGMAPSSSPAGPYSVAQLAADALAVADAAGFDRFSVAGHSMGGWVAEVLAADRPDRITAAALMGSCNAPTQWELAITRVERDVAASGVALPPLFFACETLRYLPNHDLQDDATVGGWLALIGDQEPWPNPGRLGQYEACLAWSTGHTGIHRWPTISVPCLVLAFEHDIDSPPAAARAACARIPGATYVEVAGASHLGPFTHATDVARILVEFFETATGAAHGR